MWVCVLCLRDGVSWCLTIGSRCVVYTTWVCVLCMRDGVSWCLTMGSRCVVYLSLIHISEPTRHAQISYAVFCLKKKK